MGILEIVNQRYMGTNISADEHMILGINNALCLDCNNGGDDCSTGDYET